MATTAKEQRESLLNLVLACEKLQLEVTWDISAYNAVVKAGHLIFFECHETSWGLEGEKVKLGGPKIPTRLFVSERGWQEKQSQRKRSEEGTQEQKKTTKKTTQKKPLILMNSTSFYHQILI